MRHGNYNIVDIIGALLILLVGASTSLYALTYTIGSIQRMGPGFFPLMLGIILVCLGLAMAATARGGGSPPPAYYGVRSAVLIIGSVSAFAIVLRFFGLLPASVALVAISAFAERGRSLLGIAFLSVILAVLVCLIFVYALDLPFDIYRFG